MEIIEKAPAKINLGLDIAGKYQDGFHELSMIMASVDLNDYLTITEIAEDKIVVESNNCKLPLNRKNDVYKEEIPYLNGAQNISSKKDTYMCWFRRRVQ